MSGCVLYTRVSGRSQAEHGYSLRQQMEALRAYCEREHHEIIEEVEDGGYSGSSLARPGLDRVRYLVGAGGVDLVLAQERDRFAREPAYIYLLKSELERHGTAMRAINDPEDGGPMGEFFTGMMDQLAKFERAMIAERTRRNRLKKTWEGKVLRSGKAHYGYRFTESGDGYEVDEDTMPVVHRIFQLVGVEGMALNSVKRLLESEGVPTPTTTDHNGGRRWSQKTIRGVVRDDVYYPHSYAEVAELVRSDVAARLDPEGTYGILWWRRRETTMREGKQVEKERPREEQVPIPAPDSGVPRNLADAARNAIKNNRRYTQRENDRLWELSGGVFVCSLCGRRMATSNRRPYTGSERIYHYYRCSTRQRESSQACSISSSYRAEKIEAEVWALVVDLLTSPERVIAGLDSLIEREREKLGGDPDRETEVWAERIADTDRQRERAQAAYLAGAFEVEELNANLNRLNEQRRTAERNLAACSGRGESLRHLERMRDMYAGDRWLREVLPALGNVPAEEWHRGAREDFRRGMAEHLLENTTPEERHAQYRKLRITVTALEDGAVEVSGPFGEGVLIGTSNPTITPARSPTRRTPAPSRAIRV